MKRSKLNFIDFPIVTQQKRICSENASVHTAVRDRLICHLQCSLIKRQLRYTLNLQNYYFVINPIV